MDYDQPLVMDDPDVDRYEFVEVQNNATLSSTTNSYQVDSIDKEGYYDLSESYLEINGRASVGATTFTWLDPELAETGATGTYAGTMGMCASAYNLFDSVRLLLDNQEIANVLAPGISDVMRTAVEYSENALPSLENQGFICDDNCYASITTGASAVVKPVNHVKTLYGLTSNRVCREPQHTSVRTVNTIFNEGHKKRARQAYQSISGNKAVFALPLRRLFPILENCKLIRGVRIEVQLVKNTIMESVWFGYGTDAGTGNATFVIDRLNLWLPRVQPSLSAIARLEAKLRSGEVIKNKHLHMNLYRQTGVSADAGVRSFRLGTEVSRPSHCIVAFQYSARQTSMHLNSLQFDVPPISTLRMFCNNKQFPQREIDVSSGRYARTMFEISHYMGKQQAGDRDCGVILSPERWQKCYPLFLIDLNESNTSLSSSNVADLRLDWVTTASASGAYDVYVLLFSKREFELHLKDGKTLFKHGSF